MEMVEKPPRNLFMYVAVKVLPEASKSIVILKRTFLWQSWHFEPLLLDDIFVTKLQESLEVASTYLLSLFLLHFERNILMTKLTLWADPLRSHFRDKFAAKLDVSTNYFPSLLPLHFEKDILVTKLTIWTSPLRWHFHDKVAAKLDVSSKYFLSLLPLHLSRKCPLREEAQSVNILTWGRSI